MESKSKSHFIPQKKKIFQSNRRWVSFHENVVWCENKTIMPLARRKHLGRARDKKKWFLISETPRDHSRRLRFTSECHKA